MCEQRGCRRCRGERVAGGREFAVADDRRCRAPRSRAEAQRKADLKRALHALLDDPRPGLDDKLRNALKSAAKDLLARKDVRPAASNWAARSGLRRSLSRADSTS